MGKERGGEQGEGEKGWGEREGEEEVDNAKFDGHWK